MQVIYSSTDTKTKYSTYYREIEILEKIKSKVNIEIDDINKELTKFSEKTKNSFEYSLSLDLKPNFLSFCYINNLNIDYNKKKINSKLLEKINESSEKILSFFDNFCETFLFPNMVLTINRNKDEDNINFLSFTFIIPENYFICPECGDYVYDYVGINGSYELFCTYCLTYNDKKVIFNDNIFHNENLSIQPQN